jgi:hypothetical protein
MKTAFSFFVFFSLVISVTVDAQINKTQLGVDVSRKYQENFATLSQYTWNRQIEASLDGKPALSMLSSVTVTPEGKPFAQMISKEFHLQKTEGTQGETKEPGEDELKEYIKNTIELSESYVFITEAQMVDLFNRGTVSEIYNLFRAEAFNFLKQGDHLIFSFDQTSLRCMNQSFSTIVNGDPVQADITYQVVNGINTVDKITLNLPAKKMTVVATYSNYAKKL